MITINTPPETGIMEIAAAFETIGLKLQFVPLENHWITVPFSTEETITEQPKDYADCEGVCTECAK